MASSAPEFTSLIGLRHFRPRNHRRILLAFPRYAHSFGTFDHAFALVGVRAFMPPQGPLVVAALLPDTWEARWVDENIRPVRAEELAWADAVFISGMHLQRANILELNRRAHEAGKLTVLGGPAVSAAPEEYPEVDLLHCGEVGDGTLRLWRHLDASLLRPGHQVRFSTTERLPLADFPSPAYSLVDFRQYMLGSIQFSSGCPFTCEFCDIPALYGRKPRLKTPAQVIGELDQLLAGGVYSVYFVDDNFIANPKATLELLPRLVEWQRRHGYPLILSCEATLNLAAYPEVLEGMRQAGFVTVFCGIETPEPGALRAMGKTQNLRRPVLESIATLNRYGLEVAAGILLGLDTDTPETPQAIIDFAGQSGVPLLTVNLLYALPHTPLHDRLQAVGRIAADEGRDSNIIFREPYERVVGGWREVIAAIYQPANLYARFAAQMRQTYPNRHRAGRGWKQLTWRNAKRAVRILSRIIWQVGVRSDYRREFWRMFRTQLRAGDIESIFHIATVAHHLIRYARECTQGRMPSSNFSRRAAAAPADRRSGGLGHGRPVSSS